MRSPWEVPFPSPSAGRARPETEFNSGFPFWQMVPLPPPE